MNTATAIDNSTPTTVAWDSVDACDWTGWDDVAGQVYCWCTQGHDGPHFDESHGWWTVKETTDDD